MVRSQNSWFIIAHHFLLNNAIAPANRPQSERAHRQDSGGPKNLLLPQRFRGRLPTRSDRGVKGHKQKSPGQSRAAKPRSAALGLLFPKRLSRTTYFLKFAF